MSAGLTAGLLDIIVAVSLASLIFTGPLAEQVHVGIGMVLVTAVIVSIIIALTGSIPGTVAVPQECPAVILALMSTALLAALPAAPGTPGTERVLTVLAAGGLATLLTGTFFLLLGRFRLGNLIRFVPYPVVGGFLAGTGWLLVQGSFTVMIGRPLEYAQLPYLVQLPTLAHGLPGLLFGVALFVITRRYRHFLIAPAMLIGACLLFYLLILLAGSSLQQAGAGGWLLDSLPAHRGGGSWRPLFLMDLSAIRWSAIAGQAGNIGLILAISVLSLLLNANALALALRRDVDLNRELAVAGVANIAAGLCGGLVGFHALTDSLLAHRMGAHGRLVGLVKGLLCGAALFFGAGILAVIPRPVLGGLLLFLGLDFLVEWVIGGWSRLSRTEYLLVLAILLIVGLVGFWQGIAVGVLAGVGLFIINYSRIKVIKYELSGANYHSHVDRPDEHHQLLIERGPQVAILQLQGFIFFGTADNLLEHLRRRLNDAHRLPLRFCLLDFRQVSGLDSSAVFSFIRMKQLAEMNGLVLVFTHLTPPIRRPIEREVAGGPRDETVRLFDDLDYALEWCENRLLLDNQISPEVEHWDLRKELERQLQRPELAGRLMGFLERMEVAAGFVLMRQGEPTRDLYFIEAGQVTVQLELEEGKTYRLRTMGGGAIVGEMSFYLQLGRSAEVVANRPSTLYRLSADALDRIEIEDLEVAAALHRFIARLLARRLMETNNTLQAMLDYSN